MKTEIFTFCDFAQENGGKLTIVGTFDTIISREFPCAHPMLSVVIRLRFDLSEFDDHTFRIETRDLIGRMTIDPIRGNIGVKDGDNTTAVSNLVFTVSNLRFENAGLIYFILYIDDKEIASIPLYIKKG
jgi:hypothetical protein